MARLFKTAGWENVDAVHYGKDDDGLDCVWYGATASTYVWWDESADTWYFGQDDYGADVYFYGATSGCYLLWDASEDLLSQVVTAADTSGTTRVCTVALTMSTAASGSTTEMVKFTTTANVKVGAINTLYVLTDFSTNGLVHNACANIVSEIIFPGSGSLTRGTYRAFSIEWGCPASFDPVTCVMACFHVDAWGDTKSKFDTNGYLFEIQGITAGTGKFFDDSSTATANAVLRIIIGTTPYYILLSTSA